MNAVILELCVIHWFMVPEPPERIKLLMGEEYANSRTRAR